MPLLYIHIYSINTKALIRCSGIEEYNLAETISVSLPRPADPSRSCAAQSLERNRC